MDDGQQDHRARSGQAKRARMRERLLEATLAACVSHGRQTVIEDVLRLADVSRGTFYAHFDSLHDAVSAAGQQLADSEVDTLLALYADVGDPVQLCAVGPQAVMAHAVVNPAWAFVLTQSDNFLGGSRFVTAIRTNLSEFRRADGHSRTQEIEALVDLNIGMMIRAARSLQDREAQRWPYITQAAAILLRAMGVSAAEAGEAAAWAAHDLKIRGPARLPWWRDFD